MIFTVTLNPAIDRTIVLDSLERGNVNRVKYSRFDIGGKGINVSKVLKSLHVKSTAAGFLGRKNADTFLDYLKYMDICTRFFMLDGEVRTNIKIVEENSGLSTDINEKGMNANDSDAEDLTNMLLSLVGGGDVVVISGSVPAGISNDIYGKMILRFNEKGVRVILDGDGEVLRKGIESVPYAVKPNISELKSIIDVDESDMRSIIDGGKALVGKGIEKVLISLGSKGALYITGKNCFYAQSLDVMVKSTVGAGDAMTAAIAYSIENGFSDFDTIKLACACASAAVMADGTQPPEYDFIKEMIYKVKVEEL